VLQVLDWLKTACTVEVTPYMGEDGLALASAGGGGNGPTVGKDGAVVFKFE
jgi:hypothetical protein